MNTQSANMDLLIQSLSVLDFGQLSVLLMIFVVLRVSRLYD